jgi:hypothetical protein
MHGASDHIIGCPNFLGRAARQGQWQANDKITTIHGALDCDQCKEDQEDNDPDRRFCRHAHETVKGLFLSSGIHFAVLVFSHL